MSKPKVRGLNFDKGAQFFISCRTLTRWGS